MYQDNKNSIAFIQNKIEEGYFLSYMPISFIKENSDKDIITYEFLDFLSFDPRESTYISGVISSIEDKELSLDDYIIGLIPMELFLNYFLLYSDMQSLIVDDLDEEIKKINELYIIYKNSQKSRNDKNGYNLFLEFKDYIYNKFLIENILNLDVIILNHYISEYNVKNNYHTQKLNISNSDNMLLTPIITYYFEELIVFLAFNKKPSKRDIISIRNLLISWKDYLWNIEKQGSNVTQNKLLELLYVLYTANLLGKDLTGIINNEAEYNIIKDIINDILVMQTGGSRDADRLQNDSYDDFLDVLNNGYSTFLTKFYTLMKNK